MKKNKQINIFIVEDNEVFTVALKANIETFFKKKPIKIHTFETGEACMDKFKSENPAIVILDYSLNSKHPNAANGIEILDRIKKENKETFVMMLTGDDSLSVAVQSFKHGASDYVVKTESKFQKINYSLVNLIKLSTAKINAKRAKLAFYSLFIWFTLLFAALIAALLYLKKYH